MPESSKSPIRSMEEAQAKLREAKRQLAKDPVAQKKAQAELERIKQNAADTVNKAKEEIESYWKWQKELTDSFLLGLDQAQKRIQKEELSPEEEQKLNMLLKNAKRDIQNLKRSEVNWYEEFDAIRQTAQTGIKELSQDIVKKTTEYKIAAQIFKLNAEEQNSNSIDMDSNAQDQHSEMRSPKQKFIATVKKVVALEKLKRAGFEGALKRLGGYDLNLMVSENQPNKADLDQDEALADALKKEGKPTIIRYQDQLWIYGMNREGHTQLTQSSKPHLYKLSFNEDFLIKASKHNIPYAIYQDIRSLQAHAFVEMKYERDPELLNFMQQIIGNLEKIQDELKKKPPNSKDPVFWLAKKLAMSEVKADIAKENVKENASESADKLIDRVADAIISSDENGKDLESKITNAAASAVLGEKGSAALSSVLDIPNVVGDALDKADLAATTIGDSVIRASKKSKSMTAEEKEKHQKDLALRVGAMRERNRIDAETREYQKKLSPLSSIGQALRNVGSMVVSAVIFVMDKIARGIKFGLSLFRKTKEKVKEINPQDALVGAGKQIGEAVSDAKSKIKNKLFDPEVQEGFNELVENVKGIIEDNSKKFIYKHVFRLVDDDVKEIFRQSNEIDSSLDKSIRGWEKQIAALIKEIVAIDKQRDEIYEIRRKKEKALGHIETFENDQIKLTEKIKQTQDEMKIKEAKIDEWSKLLVKITQAIDLPDRKNKLAKQIKNLRNQDNEIRQFLSENEYKYYQGYLSANKFLSTVKGENPEFRALNVVANAIAQQKDNIRNYHTEIEVKSKAIEKDQTQLTAVTQALNELQGGKEKLIEDSKLLDAKDKQFEKEIRPLRAKADELQQKIERSRDIDKLDQRVSEIEADAAAVVSGAEKVHRNLFSESSTTTQLLGGAFKPVDNKTLAKKDKIDLSESKIDSSELDVLSSHKPSVDQSGSIKPPNRPK